MEQHWHAAEARKTDLEVSLKTCTSELEAMNFKFRECAGRLSQEESKNEVLITVNAQLQEKVDQLEKMHKKD